jgi:hypothetical protein
MNHDFGNSLFRKFGMRIYFFLGFTLGEMCIFQQKLAIFEKRGNTEKQIGLLESHLEPLLEGFLFLFSFSFFSLLHRA